MAFKKDHIPWNKNTKGVMIAWNKGKIGYRKGLKGHGFKKGMIPWNKGKKGLQIGWNKGIKGLKPYMNITGLLKERKRGYKLSEETKKKIGLANKGKLLGEKNHNWKGGITSKSRLERVKFRQMVQKKVYERDSYTCQICGKKGGKLQVDHIQPWSEYIEQRFNIENCRTLCMKCHYEITFNKPMPPETKVWGYNLKNLVSEKEIL